MKTRSLLWSLLACAAFSACSSDEAVENDVLTGGDSYVSIRLVTSNGDLDSRGSAGNPDFELGTADEAKVTNAHFYFYDAAGNFEVEGKTLSSSELFGETLPNQSANSNIETKGNVNVVLENVKELPTSVLVVLNMSNEDADGMFKISLAKSYEALASSHTGWGYTAGGVQYFTMTNSSYIDDGSVVKATPVTTNHLQKTPDLAILNPITIYVERMAAKVQLKTVENMTSSTTADVQLDEEAKSSKTLNITVDAWGVNGVNQSSYYMKEIDNSWTYPWWKPTTELYRSYWAKDSNYDSGSYPTDAASHDELNTDGSSKEWSLKYFTAEEIKEAYGTGENSGKPQYCLENTLGENIMSNYMTNATHVILLATMKVGDGEAEDLYNYKGVLYDLTNYKKVALHDLNASKQIFKKTTSDGANIYTQITINDVEINSLTDGKVNLKMQDNLQTEGIWFKGNSDSAEAYTVEELNNLFKNLNNAEGYKNGMMYYAIPIEHLASSTVDNENLQVGDYGVVRNHYYTITVTKIENLGKGIYEPNEVIVPNYDPETYYVAAQLNVLSWKTVSQSVEL